MKKTEKRTTNFNMRVSPSQKRKAKKLAKAAGRTLADWTLQLWEAEGRKPTTTTPERTPT